MVISDYILITEKIHSKEPLGDLVGLGSHVDISELLGVPDLIAKSTTAQIMSGGTIIDGVLINKAEGVDIKNIGDGHPMKQIRLIGR